MAGEFSVRTRARTDFIDVTALARDAVLNSGVSGGLLVLFVPHTTAAITINENADPSVLEDMKHALDRIVPWSDPAFSHSEGNSAAHVKSSMLGCSQTIFISQGMLQLGTWQGLFLCEFDGPRTRKIMFRIVG